MKRKARQRRGHPVKVRYQPYNAGARWVVWWSGGGYSYFGEIVPPVWLCRAILGRAPAVRDNNFTEWRL